MQAKHDAFEKIKRILACDNLLTYLDFNEMFKINTDASSFQLGEKLLIPQNGIQ